LIDYITLILKKPKGEESLTYKI